MDLTMVRWHDSATMGRMCVGGCGTAMVGFAMLCPLVLQLLVFSTTYTPRKGVFSPTCTHPTKQHMCTGEERGLTVYQPLLYIKAMLLRAIDALELPANPLDDLIVSLGTVGLAAH